MKVLWKYLKPYKKQIVIGPVFKLLEAILELMIPMLMAFLIDYGVKMNDGKYIFKTGALMLIIAIVGLLFAYICQYSASIASQGFGTNLRGGVFKHICSLSYSEIENYGTASMVNRITNDINVMQQGVAMIIRLFIRAPFICIGSIVMSLFIDVKLTMIFVISLPVFVLAIFIVMKTTIPLYKKLQGKTDKISSALRESLSGVRVIRAFAKKDEEKEKFELTNSEFEALAVRTGKISAVLNPVTTLIMNIVIVAILYFGATRVNNGFLSQGQITAFISYGAYMTNALVVLASLIVLLTKAAASSSRVAQLLNIECENDGEKINDTKSNEVISFHDVSFSYNKGGESAIENINFTLLRGEKIGVIGGTGAGKTTVINLITRLYRATSGEVLIDEVNVNDYSHEKLSKKIAVVSQKATLLSGSVADNIRQGKADATDEEIIEALTAAQAIDFVMSKENGINSIVATGGDNFSGGQKQRLSIARALVKKPEILILDDSSSALDYATDAKLAQAISEFSENMTVINISQRVSSILDSDKILLLHQGEQLCFDTHEALLSSCPLYRDICASQLKEGNIDD